MCGYTAVSEDGRTCLFLSLLDLPMQDISLPFPFFFSPPPLPPHRLLGLDAHTCTGAIGNWAYYAATWRKLAKTKLLFSRRPLHPWTQRGPRGHSRELFHHVGEHQLRVSVGILLSEPATSSRTIVVGRC